MKTDRITKALLAIIAVALWGILLRPFCSTDVAKAQESASSAKAQTIRAQDIQIVDGKGKVCGVIGGSDGGAGIAFLGRDQKPRMMLGLVNEVPALTMTDTAGESRMEIMLADGVNPSVILHGKGKSNALLVVD